MFTPGLFSPATSVALRMLWLCWSPDFSSGATNKSKLQGSFWNKLDLTSCPTTSKGKLLQKWLKCQTYGGDGEKLRYDWSTKKQSCDISCCVFLLSGHCTSQSYELWTTSGESGLNTFNTCCTHQEIVRVRRVWLKHGVAPGWSLQEAGHNTKTLNRTLHRHKNV